MVYYRNETIFNGALSTGFNNEKILQCNGQINTKKHRDVSQNGKLLLYSYILCRLYMS